MRNVNDICTVAITIASIFGLNFWEELQDMHYTRLGKNVHFIIVAYLRQIQIYGEIFLTLYKSMPTRLRHENKLQLVFLLNNHPIFADISNSRNIIPLFPKCQILFLCRGWNVLWARYCFCVEAGWAKMSPPIVTALLLHPLQICRNLHQYFIH